MRSECSGSDRKYGGRVVHVFSGSSKRELSPSISVIRRPCISSTILKGLCTSGRAQIRTWDGGYSNIQLIVWVDAGLGSRGSECGRLAIRVLWRQVLISG